MAERHQAGRAAAYLGLPREGANIPVLPSVLPRYRQSTLLHLPIPAITSAPAAGGTLLYCVQASTDTVFLSSQDGRPIYIEQLGKVDIAAMNKITTSERMLTNLAVEYERVADPRLPACSRKAGHLLETCCTIMDLKGVGLGKAPSVYGYLKSASNMSQNYYPERLGKLFVINAPWGFSTIWGAIKGWIDPVTVQKIHILGSGYQKELLQHVSPEALPKAFGGTCECPGGCMFSDIGPWTDPQFAKPPKWEKKADGAAAAAPATTIETKQDNPQAAPADAAAPAPAAVEEGAKADAPAPAAA